MWEILAEYRKDNPDWSKRTLVNREHENPKVLEEDRDYLFDRWAWFWKQQLDEKGNIVSPSRSWDEWQKYYQDHQLKTHNVLAKTTSGANWTFQGPSYSQGGYEGIGRIATVAFHPTDVNTYWVGTAGGGVWKTTNNGQSWTCLTDNLPTLSVSNIIINPLRPNTMYITTGDRDITGMRRGFFNYGVGVLKSYDGGQTWDTTSMSWAITDFKVGLSLIMNPQDTNTLILGTKDGIYRTHNGGASWTQLTTGCFMQVLYHPTDTNIIYATSFESGSTPAQIYRSANAGATWTQVSSFTGVKRVTIAVTPANPSIVKAIAANDVDFGMVGIYSSSDVGQSFQQIYSDNGCTTNMLGFDPSGNGCGGQGWYTLPICISPTNANDMYIGGVNTWHSTDGGNTWQVMNQWAFQLASIAVVHADKHFLGYHPLMSTRLFECNDGGIYYTDDPVNLWNDVSNGMGISQFYRNAVAGVANYVLGGAQDDGTKYIENGNYYMVTGGDGMECQIDYTDSSTVYTSAQYGSIFQVNLTSGTSNQISNNIPNMPTGEWVTPFVLHPFDNNTLFAGYQEVFMTNDQGNSWVSISPQFTFNTVTGLQNNLSRIATTYADANTLYVAEEDTNLIHYTHNLGTSWTNVIPPYNGIISDIKVDPKNGDHYWISFTGYTNTKVAEYKPGTGWQSVSGGLPNIPIHCIEIDTSNGTLYIGTDGGVFYKDDTMSNWVAYNTGLPNVHVFDLGINYVTNELWAATFGRGMWKSAKIMGGPTRVNEIVSNTSAIKVSPNPNKGRFTVNMGDKLASQSVRIRLINNAGKTVWQESISTDASGTCVLNAGGLGTGVYTLELYQNNRVIGFQKILIN
ncbi:MAG: T9SS type A sorting domain-containing protein [Bacteroidota bacterium]